MLTLTFGNTEVNLHELAKGFRLLLTLGSRLQVPGMLSHEELGPHPAK